MDLLTALTLQHSDPERVLVRDTKHGGRNLRHARCLYLDNGQWVEDFLPGYELRPAGFTPPTPTRCAGCGVLVR